MKTPSVKRLVATFGINARQARLIKDLGKACTSPDKLMNLIERSCPLTEEYARSCHGDPYESRMWRRTLALHAIDCILDTHGVEALGGDSDSAKPPPYEYLNAGDAYTATLIYKRATDNLYIGTWGDIAERLAS